MDLKRCRTRVNGEQGKEPPPGVEVGDRYDADSGWWQPVELTHVSPRPELHQQSPAPTPLGLHRIMSAVDNIDPRPSV